MEYIKISEERLNEEQLNMVIVFISCCVLKKVTPHTKELEMFQSSRGEAFDEYKNICVLCNDSDDDGSLLDILRLYFKLNTFHYRLYPENAAVLELIIDNKPSGITGRDHGNLFFKEKGILVKVISGILVEIKNVLEARR